MSVIELMPPLGSEDEQFGILEEELLLEQQRLLEEQINLDEAMSTREATLDELVAVGHGITARETVLVEPFGTSFGIDIEDPRAGKDDGGCGPHTTTHMLTAFKWTKWDSQGRPIDGKHDDESF